jgi:hypothetical protein
MNGYYKTSSGQYFEIFGNNLPIILISKKIIELVLPDNTKYIYCQDNILTELIIPKKYKYDNSNK